MLPAYPFVDCTPGSAAGDELHALCYNICTGVFDQQMDVIGRHRIIEHAKTETLPGFENPMQVAAPITCELE
jgi:hypothetical protein